MSAKYRKRGRQILATTPPFRRSPHHRGIKRQRKVKILATLGPASRDKETIAKLLKAGADAFRVNMSHGDHDTHRETIANIRAVEKDLMRPVAILCDLQGPSCASALLLKARSSFATAPISRSIAIPRRVTKTASACRIRNSSAFSRRASAC
jgi:hypothetical protein